MTVGISSALVLLPSVGNEPDAGRGRSGRSAAVSKASRGTPQTLTLSNLQELPLFQFREEQKKRGPEAIPALAEMTTNGVIAARGRTPAWPRGVPCTG